MLRKTLCLLLTCGLCLALGLTYGCATGGGGGGGGGGGLQPGETTYDVDPGEAGAIEVTAEEAATSTGPADLGGDPPANPTTGTVDVAPGKRGVHPASGRRGRGNPPGRGHRVHRLRR